MKLWSVLLMTDDTSMATQVIGVWDSEAGAVRHARGVCALAVKMLAGDEITCKERMSPGENEQWFDLQLKGERWRPAFVTVEPHFLNEKNEGIDLILMARTDRSAA